MQVLYLRLCVVQSGFVVSSTALWCCNPASTGYAEYECNAHAAHGRPRQGFMLCALWEYQGVLTSITTLGVLMMKTKCM